MGTDTFARMKKETENVSKAATSTEAGFKLLLSPLSADTIICLLHVDGGLVKYMWHNWGAKCS